MELVQDYFQRKMSFILNHLVLINCFSQNGEVRYLHIVSLGIYIFSYGMVKSRRVLRVSGDVKVTSSRYALFHEKFISSSTTPESQHHNLKYTDLLYE